MTSFADLSPSEPSTPNAARTGAWRRRGAGALLALAVCAAPGMVAAKSAPSGLFGSIEIRHDDLRPFATVRAVLDRSFAELDEVRAASGSAASGNDKLAAWSKFLDGLRDRDVVEQLAAVNRYVNRARFVSDERNYNVANRWATPGQLFTRGGDCEDYVVAKYVSLRALGFAIEHLRMTTVRIASRREAHAVLVAYVDGKGYVLDNLSYYLTEARDVRAYRPVYSINENNWWLHRVR